jgi:peroxiredoxin
MKAWAADQGIENSMITFLSDPYSEFTRACDMELTNEGPRSLGLIGRTKRFAMIVEKSIIKDFAVAESELDPAGDDFPEKTLAPALIKMAE